MNNNTIRIVTALYLVIPIILMNPVMAMNHQQDKDYLNAINVEANEDNIYGSAVNNKQPKVVEKRNLTVSEMLNRLKGLSR